MNAVSIPLAKVLIIDDETEIVHALCETLRDRGYDTHGCTTGEEALKSLRERQYDLLLTDLMMPEMSGVELLAEALKHDPHIVGILMTGRGTIETAVQAMQAGALDYVLKPLKMSALFPVLSRAVNVRRLRLENMALRDTVAIHELNQAIAHTLDANVLVDKIADAALAQFDADEASVMLVTEDGNSLYVAAARGEHQDTLLGTRLPIGEGIAGWVASRREPLVFNGLSDDERLSRESLHVSSEIQSALSMPMITRNKLIGVLNVNCTRRRKIFTFGQIKVLSIFTNAAAGSLEAARLHDAQRKADARYREVLEMAADGILSIDHAHRIAIFNAGAERLFGYTAEEVVGKPLDILLPQEMRETHRHYVQAFGQGRDQSRAMVGRGQLYGRRKNGTLFDAEVGISKRTEFGETLYTAVVRDITERVAQEKRIARLTRLYAVLSGVNATIVRVADEGTLFADICRIAVEGGKFMSAIIGMPEALHGDVAIVASAGSGATEGRLRVQPESPGNRGLIALAIRERRIVWDNNLAAESGEASAIAIVPGARAGAALPFILGKDVRAVMLLNSDTPDAFGEEELSLLRDLAGDVSFALDHIEKTRQVAHFATHDQLTGLPNRTLFLDRLEQAMVLARDKGEMLAIVLTDIERFKHVNDTFGRQAGDVILRQLANRFLNAVEDHVSLARVGPDAFALILSNPLQATGVAKEIYGRMEMVTADSFTIGGQMLHLAVRAGVAFYPSDGASAETLFKNAEAALKSAKVQHERAVFYTPDLNARVAEQLAMESKLRRALDRGEFIVYYQPKASLDTDRIMGLEALIRWRHPESGLLQPIQFVPLLEETGLILQVGSWVMREAVRTAAMLRAGGMPDLRIAVNVSAIQLRQEDFVRSVEEVLAGYGGNHGLDLEITESTIMENIDDNVRKLDAIRSMGVELAIDDFGTGYSSLAYIARLPVGVIKIDRAFVRNLADDANSQSIVSSIISLTHTLQRIVVAEGVETEAQMRLLQRMGCDQYQGYLYSEPVPAERMEALLREEGARTKV